MDPFTLIGIVLGIGAILIGNWMEGGHLVALLQPTAAFIVFGGTLGGVMVQFRAKHLISAAKYGMQCIYEKKIPPARIAAQILELATKARKEGIISLEKDIPRIDNPFFARALQMAVDGINPSHLQESLEAEMDRLETESLYPAKVWDAAGGYSPTVGILGAVLGLIHVMSNLTSPDKLGAGIAVAFVATVYGVGGANLIFLPLGGKLRDKSGESIGTYTLILTGVLAILAGDNPRFIEQRLKSYLDVNQRKLLDTIKP